MKDPFFERTVVLVWHYDENGAIGVIVNRSLPHSIPDVLMIQGIDDMTLHPDNRVSWGGPVETDSGTAISRANLAQGEGWQVSCDIAITRSEDVLSRMLSEFKQVVLCLGYAGWGPGQLDAEIEAGGWLFTDATPDLVFDTHTEDGYDKALKTLGLTSETIWMQPISE
jgi:putative transcriptional regulator